MKFTLSIEIELDESSNVLSTYTANHEQDVADAVRNLLHDLDDVEVLDVAVSKASRK